MARTTELENLLPEYLRPLIYRKPTPDEHMSYFSALYEIRSNSETGKDDIYRIHQKAFQNLLNEVVIPNLRIKHGELLVREIIRCKEGYTMQVVRMCRLIMTFRNFEGPWQKLLEDGHAYFKDYVFNEFKLAVKDTVVMLIENERKGENIDKDLLKKVAHMFIAMGMDVYQLDLETPILLETANYYRKSLIHVDSSVGGILTKGEECVQEMERLSHYLHASSSCIAQTRNVIIQQYQQHLLKQDGFNMWELLQNNNVAVLSSLTRLFSHIPDGLKPFATIFCRHYVQAGMAILRDKEESSPNHEALIGRLIELNETYLHYICKFFRNHSSFHKILRGSLEAVWENGVIGRSLIQLLATFCDNVLKKGRLRDDDTKDTLEKIIRLLQYMNDQDKFLAFYKNKLANRLLHGKGSIVAHEQTMLSMLRKEVGWTSSIWKMETMLKDISQVSEHQIEWEKYLSDHPESCPGFKMSVNVLTTGIWQISEASDFVFPKEMIDAVETYSRFYNIIRRGRKLKWSYSLGRCTITRKFEDEEFEFILTPSQAACLLLFNDADRLAYKDIKNQLNLHDNELIPVLYSLSCGKYRIVNKYPTTLVISVKDVFELNLKFTHNNTRLHIPLGPAIKENKVVEKVKNVNRSYAIDACIVRIMKNKKTLELSQLISKCIEQLGPMFKPDTKTIKVQICDLIDREFLERDQHQPNIFRYIP